MALCSNCGKEMGAGIYCGGCGQRTGGGSQPPQQYPPGQYQPPQQYPQGQYQPPTAFQPQYGTPVPTSRTNGMAIASLVLSLVCCNILGIIFGHIALSQINRTGEAGRGLAVAGLVIGYASLAIGILWGLAAAGSGY